MQQLVGKTVFLRALEPSDLNTLYEWENDTKIWNLSNTVAPFSKHVLEQYIANSYQDIYTSKQLRLLICLKNETPVGCVDLFDFDPLNLRAGIGILIADKKHRNKNYSNETIALLINYCFEILHLHQLYCNINTSNTASLELFKKHKFRIAGTKKQWNKTKKGWEDELFLQRIN